MKRIALHSVVLMAALLLASCGHRGAQTERPAAESIIGTWHYRTMSRTVQGSAAEAQRWDFTADTNSAQYYDTYHPDGKLEFYIVQGDSLVAQRTFRYTFRNDTIFTETEDKALTIHLVAATDSTLSFDYTREHNDTTYYFQTESRRSELPAWLQKPQEEK